MATILVTGGLGFIGSHTTVALQQAGHEVIIIDNLSNASIEVKDRIAKITGKAPIFEQIDLREKDKVQDFFLRYPNIDGVIHFAASKAVGESVEKPLLYYENNIASLIYLLQELQKRKNTAFIFSSSCTVYGQADKLPVTEDAPFKQAECPYGNTKQINEEIIRDTCAIAKNIKAISLRGKIQGNYEVFNVGTGKGSSVLEVIKAFEKVTGQALPYKIVGRRAGDVVAAYADTHKVNEVLKWKAKQTLEEALLSAWNWEKKLRNK